MTWWAAITKVSNWDAADYLIDSLYAALRCAGGVGYGIVVLRCSAQFLKSLQSPCLAFSAS